MYDTAEENVSISHISRIIITTLCSIIVVITITGNILVLIILPKVSMQTASAKRYLYSLTIADLCTGVYRGSLLTITTGLDRWVFGDIMCAASAFMRLFFNIASLLSLFAVTVDRFLAIAYPLRYPTLVSRAKSVAVLILTLIWAIAAFFTLLYGPIIGRSPMYLPQIIFCMFTSTNPDKIDYSIIICITLFILSPFIATIILYSRIYCITRKHTLFMSQFVSPENTHQANRNMKFVKTFMLVILCFGFARLPGVIIRYMDQLSDIVIPSPCLMLSEILIISNSGVNIFIYYWRNKDFKKAVLLRVRSIMSYESISLNGSTGSHRSNKSTGVSALAKSTSQQNAVQDSSIFTG